MNYLNFALKKIGKCECNAHFHHQTNIGEHTFCSLLVRDRIVVNKLKLDVQIEHSLKIHHTLNTKDYNLIHFRLDIATIPH
jgi:hypothetical protein